MYVERLISQLRCNTWKRSRGQCRKPDVADPAGRGTAAPPNPCPLPSRTIPARRSTLTHFFKDGVGRMGLRRDRRNSMSHTPSLVYGREFKNIIGPRYKKKVPSRRLTLTFCILYVVFVPRNARPDRVVWFDSAIMDACLLVHLTELGMEQAQPVVRN